jgi:NDP-sugar pyrophosphorylase family protein
VIQLVIPMAGLGSRFTAAGFTIPKPLIPVHGVEMYKLVLSNLISSQVARIVLICPRSFGMKRLEPQLTRATSAEVTIVEIEALTSGPASTVNLAKGELNLSEPLVIANSDQYVDFLVDDFYKTLLGGDYLGAVLTMQDDDPKWSYAEVDSACLIRRVVEKEVISTHATVGIYGFSVARDFFEAYDSMTEADFRVNGEFYVAPSYEFSPKFQSPGAKAIDLGPVGSVMYGLGIPKDLETFIAQPLSKQACENASILFQAPSA